MVVIDVRLTRTQLVWLVWSVVAFILAIAASVDTRSLQNSIWGFLLFFLLLDGLGFIVIGFGWIFGLANGAKEGSR